MQIDITFDYAKVFDVRRLNIVKGQSFTFHIHHRYRLFSDNDEVLDLKVRGGKVEVTGAKEGRSTLLILNDELDIKRHLFVRVVASVQPQAGDLGVSADAPVPK